MDGARLMATMGESSVQPIPSVTVSPVISLTFSEISLRSFSAPVMMKRSDLNWPGFSLRM